MKKSVLEIYSLAVCFIGVVALVISLGTGIFSSLAIMFPDFTIDQWQYEQHQTNEKYWENHPNRYPPELKGEMREKPSDEKLTKMRNESYEIVLKSEQRNGAQTLVNSVIFFIISTFVFFIHWRIFKKSSKNLE